MDFLPKEVVIKIN